jgi:DNA polymerase-3 subunit delta'
MTAVSFYPWQTAMAKEWLARRDRFAHAWLIQGPEGIGKLHFAIGAAASLLCETPDQGLACGHCAACLWIAAGNHPDLRRIRPDAIALEEGAENQTDAEEGPEPASGTAAKRAPSKEIRIDQIRALESWFNMATHRGGFRLALLYPAQSLNTVSANALLKMLEEPPAHTVFLLVADKPDRLLPTLVSRCRRLPMPTPTPAESLAWLAGQGVDSPSDWLAAAGGAPLAALRLATARESACPPWLESLLQALASGTTPDVGMVAESLDKQPAAQWIDVVQRVLVDLSLAAVGAPVRYFPALAPLIQRAAARTLPSRLADGAQWFNRQRAVANHPFSARLFAHAALQRLVLSCQGSPVA